MTKYHFKNNKISNKEKEVIVIYCKTKLYPIYYYHKL